MAIPSYYFKEKFVKMGKWVLLPADSENWHGPHTSEYFKKIFGFGKGTTIIQTLDNDLQHAYFPKFYVKKIYTFIYNTNKSNYLALANILKSFYKLKDKAKREIPKIAVADFSKISTKKLIDLYRKNRDWAHRVTPYDQFGWVAEDYWNLVMERILVKKLKLSKGSPEYYRVLFILTKPEEISTTLEEKRDVLAQAIKLKIKKQSISRASIILAKKYGWMPVFTFGIPWDKKHYINELSQLVKKPISFLKEEHNKLIKYSLIRNNDLQAVVKKCHINEKDLQIFVDFGLTLDARNEAEYLVSLAGYYLLPMYDEIARRLALSVKQVRFMYENEIVAALWGKLDYHKSLSAKGSIIGWGYNRQMNKRFEFTSREARKFFDHVESYVKNMQGGEEGQGLCANNGVARGKARIVLLPSDNSKVKQGDILITHATTVDYLPAMKKAAAFVTEVGGLTCHAAVVSREFGVPCIVGFKNATKKFKDGDLVEVDAGKGLLKKIK